jgi:hypothetical protein
MEQTPKRRPGRPYSKDPAIEYIHIRVTPGEKAAYVGAAKKAGVKLTQWLKALADAALH